VSVTLQLHGLEELKTALRNLPADLAEEAGRIVVAHATEAEHQIHAAYPTGPTGHLKRGVRLTVEPSSRVGVSATVKSSAPHAFIFERGTARRSTRKGANRGQMPTAPANERMIPIVIRARRRMVAALIQMVQKAGLVVTSS